MIIESIVAGLTTIFVSSLMFAHAQIKSQRRREVEDLERERRWDAEDNAPPPPPKPEPKVYPFIEIQVGTPCPKCKRPAKNQVLKRSNGYSYVESESEGPAWPQACNNSSCEARHLPHLHARCYTCHYNWFMSPADESKQEKPKEEKKEEKDDNRQPHPPGTEQPHQS